MMQKHELRIMSHLAKFSINTGVLFYTFFVLGFNLFLSFQIIQPRHLESKAFLCTLNLTLYTEKIYSWYNFLSVRQVYQLQESE
jgi:hypothetical protein